METASKKSCACKGKSVAKRTIVKEGKKINVLNILSGFIFLLFPKCPVCWAAYASIFSFIGIEHVTYNSNWKYVILSVFLLGSLFLIRKHLLNKSWLNIILYASGMLLLLITYYLNVNQTWWLFLIALFMLVSNFSFEKNQKVFNY